MMDLRDRLEKAREDSDEYPAPWYPDEGEVLVGELLHYSSAPTRYGTMRIAVIREEETGGEVSVWLSRRVLQVQFEKEDPKPGDQVGIKFHGSRKSKKGRAFFDYTVAVERAPSAG